MDVPRTPPVLFTVLSALFQVLLAVSIGLFGVVLVVPGHSFPGFHDLSNYTQLFTSAMVTIACAYAYARWSRDVLLLHAGFAAGGWTLANAFWYSYTLIIGTSLPYPTVADAGFIGVFPFLIAGYQEVFARNRFPSWIGLLVLCPLAAGALWLMADLGVTPATLLTLLFFLLCGSLVVVSLLYSVYLYRVLFLGTLAISLTHLLNAYRSTVLEPHWLFGIVGPLAAISFALLGIGLLVRTKEALQ
ncbi:MAG TPA: hypothetical protein PK089_07585 [Methanoregulaceae archaeon]|nr:hypothetical protein [Methanoregulaceae archaeon]HQJ87528.1 hypothetical protein [Methanoregulaceae archaeon]